MTATIRRSYCDIADVRTRVCPPGELPSLELVETMGLAIIDAADRMNDALQASGARLPYGANEWRDARHVNAIGAAAAVSEDVAGMAEFDGLVQAMCQRLGGKVQEAQPDAPLAARIDEPAPVAAEVAAPARASRRRAEAHRDEAAE